MDNRKTGQLISEKRKQKNMTQQELAEKLHVTNTAVSKWERGLSFPGVDILEKLALELDISVMDILAGEISEKAEADAEKISLDIMRTEKKKRNRLYFVCIAAVILILITVFFKNYGPAIFQRGYPVPYIKAMVKISEKTPLIQVQEGVYITKKGNKQPVFEYMKEKWNAEFLEQAGNGYIFFNGTDRIVISSEIYWGRYTVWDIPNITLQTK